MAKYSFSQIQTFMQCWLKYRFKYIDKLEKVEFEETADTLLWKAVHYSLEKFYNNLNNFKNCDENFLINTFNDYWKENMKSSLLIKWEYWIDDYKNRWEFYLKNFYRNFIPVEDLRVVATELMLNFKIDQNIDFTWFIDRLDSRKKIFIINDYKTNKNLPPTQKELYIEQLYLYSIWVLQLYWKYIDKIIAKIYYLHFDIEDEFEIEKSTQELIRQKYVETIKQIEQKKFEYSFWNKEIFEPIENNFCKYCEYYSICPLYSHMTKQDEIIRDLSEKTLKTIIDEYVETSKKIIFLTNDKENLKNMLVEYIKRNDYKKLYWFNSKISVTKQKIYQVKDKEKLKTILSKKWILDQFQNIDLSILKSKIKNNELSLSELDWSVESNDSFIFRSW